MTTPPTENLDAIIPKREVSESKSETSDVAIARIRSDSIRFLVVAGCCFTIVLIIVLFLMYNFSTSQADAQGKIITALAAVLSAALGVFVGKKI